MRSLVTSIVRQYRDERSLQAMGENAPGRIRALRSGIRLGVWLWRFAKPRGTRFALRGHSVFDHNRGDI